MAARPSSAAIACGQVRSGRHSESNLQGGLHPACSPPQSSLPWPLPAPGRPASAPTLRPGATISEAEIIDSSREPREGHGAAGQLIGDAPSQTASRRRCWRHGTRETSQFSVQKDSTSAGQSEMLRAERGAAHSVRQLEAAPAGHLPTGRPIGRHRVRSAPPKRDSDSRAGAGAGPPPVSSWHALWGPRSPKPSAGWPVALCLPRNDVFCRMRCSRASCSGRCARQNLTPMAAGWQPPARGPCPSTAPARSGRAGPASVSSFKFLLQDSASGRRVGMPWPRAGPGAPRPGFCFGVSVRSDRRRFRVNSDPSRPQSESLDPRFLHLRARSAACGSGPPASARGALLHEAAPNASCVNETLVENSNSRREFEESLNSDSRRGAL